MLIAFISNYFNHHQESLSDCFDVLTEQQYYFIATKKMRDERKKLGYDDKLTKRYVLDISNNDKKTTDVKAVVDNADVIITGGFDENYTKDRIKEGKLVFRYWERPFKNKPNIIKYLPRYIKWNLKNPRNASVYLLAASAYTVNDCWRYGIFRNKSYKWGYFPRTKYYENIENIFDKKDKNRILWCGRFIDWKHPDDAIEAANMLKKDGYTFTLDFIGTGVMEEDMKNLVLKYNLSDCVHFLGAMKTENVRAEMEKSGIYLVTSDRKEGWGAVVNEAMNSACATIVSHAVGAAPYLIDNNQNGMIYESGNTNELYHKIKYLLDNSDKQEQYGLQAYNTIANEWNAKVASERLLHLSKCILNGDKYPELYNSGPCSKAELIKDDWYSNER